MKKKRRADFGRPRSGSVIKFMRAKVDLTESSHVVGFRRTQSRGEKIQRRRTSEEGEGCPTHAQCPDLVRRRGGTRRRLTLRRETVDRLHSLSAVLNRRFGESSGGTLENGGGDPLLVGKSIDILADRGWIHLHIGDHPGSRRHDHGRRRCSQLLLVSSSEEFPQEGIDSGPSDLDPRNSDQCALKSQLLDSNQ